MRQQKVLVVEDDDELRRGHAGMLTSEGYEVFEAATTADALRLTRAERPDLVLLDASLPD
ncbi:MAG TPA: response regulator, partial [Pyrinomonadaceae bacterium]